MKIKIVPFDLETAKKIQAGKIEGRIVIRLGVLITKIMFWDAGLDYDVAAIVDNKLHTYTINGYERLWDKSNRWGYDLVIELPEEAPKYEFKVGNKVRVNLPKDVVTKYLILGNYQGKVATIINVEGSYVKVKADGLQPYSFDVDYLIPYEEKHEFKPFDKVLVKPYDMSESMEDVNCWRADVFSHIDKCTGDYVCIGGLANPKYTLPYEDNEHLVGTTDKPNEE